jgi:predicted nucleic acid-binding protein
MAAPRAIIDADVLYRRHARNLLVWHALDGLFQLLWSRRILNETRANLLPDVGLAPPKRRETVDQILNRVTESIHASGAGAEVPEAEIDAIERAMTNDPKDRHVLAAAVACSADTIITTNTKDFPPAATERTAPQPDHQTTSSSPYSSPPPATPPSPHCETRPPSTAGR